MKFGKKLYFVVPLVFIMDPLAAFELEFDAGVGVEHTDNAQKRADNGDSDYITGISGGIVVTHESESIQIEVDYRALYTEYKDDTQQDSTEVVGDARLFYEQIQNSLFWTLTNSVRNIIRDKQFADNADNRENRSITTLSPEWRLRIGSVDTLNTSLSYVRVSYEDSGQQDSDRLGGDIVWGHDLSSIYSFDVTAIYQDVNFDNGINDYEYYSGRLGFNAELSRLSYRFVLGYNESQRDRFEDTDGTYVNANFIYVSGSSQWELDLLQELTDTSRGNNNDGLTDLGDATTAGRGVDIYEVTSAELIYTTEVVCELCTFSVAVLMVDESYKILPDDNLELGGRINLSYRLSRQSTIDFDVSYQDYTFRNGNPRQDYYVQRYGLIFSHDLTRKFTVDASVSHETRNSHTDVLEYDETRAGISINYQFL